MKIGLVLFSGFARNSPMTAESCNPAIAFSSSGPVTEPPSPPHDAKTVVHSAKKTLAVRVTRPSLRRFAQIAKADQATPILIPKRQPKRGQSPRDRDHRCDVKSRILVMA